MIIKEGKGGKMDKARKHKEHKITIKLDDDGNFTYDNPLIWVHAEDTIVWELTNQYPFAIHAGWNSPLEKGRYRSEDGTRIEAKVAKGAQPSYYHYAVAVFDEKTRKIWIDDPPFIVKPG